MYPLDVGALTSVSGILRTRYLKYGLRSFITRTNGLLSIVRVIVSRGISHYSLRKSLWRYSSKISYLPYLYSDPVQGGSSRKRSALSLLWRMYRMEFVLCGKILPRVCVNSKFSRRSSYVFLSISNESILLMRGNLCLSIAK